MFSLHQSTHYQDLPWASLRFTSFSNLVVSALRTLSLPCGKSKKLTPLFSHSSALFKEAHSGNSFPINRFRTLSQNTGGGTPPLNRSTASFVILRLQQPSLAAKSHRIRTYVNFACNPSRMNTCKNKGLKVLWNEHLRKNRGGGTPFPRFHFPKSSNRPATSNWYSQTRVDREMESDSCQNASKVK